jgi:hypothetical protein
MGEPVARPFFPLRQRAQGSAVQQVSCQFFDNLGQYAVAIAGFRGFLSQCGGSHLRHTVIEHHS